jgi:hypothetical protein
MDYKCNIVKKKKYTSIYNLYHFDCSLLSKIVWFCVPKNQTKIAN